MVAAVLGLSQYTTPHQAWEIITGRRIIEDNDAMTRGRVAERFIADLSKEKGFKVIRQQIPIAHKEYTWATGTIDATGEYEERFCLLEFKSASNIRSAEDLPLSYILQVQWYLGIWNSINEYLSTNVAYINIVDGFFNFYSFRIDYNHELFTTILEKVRIFYEKYVVTDTPPPMTDADKLAILNYLQPNGAIELSEEIENTIEELETIKTQIKALETKKEELENKVKLALYDKEQGFGKKYSVSFKSQTRETIDAKNLKQKHPDIYNSFVKTSEFRVLRITTKK
jgi:predicted phage-related endonuclease